MAGTQRSGSKDQERRGAKSKIWKVDNLRVVSGVGVAWCWDVAANEWTVSGYCSERICWIPEICVPFKLVCEVSSACGWVEAADEQDSGHFQVVVVEKSPLFETRT